MSTTAPEYILPPLSLTNLATSGTASAATAIGFKGYVTFDVETSNVRIKFGRASSMTTITVIQGSSIPAGGSKTWYIPDYVTHFIVIAAGAGYINWYQSGP